MRAARIERKTRETDIKLSIDLDGSGKSKVVIPLGFMSHMFDLLIKNSLFDLEIDAKGDLYVDEHHIVEDMGIVLGEAFSKALVDKKGITRFGTAILPMDEVLALVSIDISGRPLLAFDAKFDREKVGDLATELVYDFFSGFSQGAKVTLHIKLLTQGRNDHHRIEAIFKAFGRALRQAAAIDQRVEDIPSTKGVI
ncbi:MAG: imidazoleglycerol-phosphate dehydratase HisB [Nanoarchaeota archaeon]|nr:imidazoleglycerol-phosphate dehydratase HisB [Nanoarchaeota archaeon]